MKNSFWITHIRSTEKFREKYNLLYLQSKQKKQASTNRFNQFQQNKYDFEELEKELFVN